MNRPLLIYSILNAMLTVVLIVFMIIDHDIFITHDVIDLMIFVISVLVTSLASSMEPPAQDAHLEHLNTNLMLYITYLFWHFFILIGRIITMYMYSNFSLGYIVDIIFICITIIFITADRILE